MPNRSVDSTKVTATLMELTSMKVLRTEANLIQIEED